MEDTLIVMSLGHRRVARHRQGRVMEDMAEDTEVMDPDPPRVANQNDVAVKVHTIHSGRLVSLMPKQKEEDMVMVLAAVESRVRDRQRAARDQVMGMDLDMVDMAHLEVVRAAKQDRITRNMMEDTNGTGICVSLSKCLYKRCVAYVKCD